MDENLKRKLIKFQVFFNNKSVLFFLNKALINKKLNNMGIGSKKNKYDRENENVFKILIQLSMLFYKLNKR